MSRTRGRNKFNCCSCGKVCYRAKSLYGKTKRHYCDRVCFMSDNRVVRKCDNCGKQKQIQASRDVKGRRYFCDASCWRATTHVKFECSWCGKRSELITSHFKLRKDKVCSRKCLSQKRKQINFSEIKCYSCGKVFSRYTSKVNLSKKRTFCSRDCRRTGHLTSKGYRVVFRRGKYQQEHRIIVDQALRKRGLRLTKKMTVHHRNGIRSDNRLRNLQIKPKAHGAGQTVPDLVRHLQELGVRVFVPKSLRNLLK